MILPQSYIFQDTIRFLSSRTNIQDYWGAKSWQLFKGYWSNGRITSLILSGRILITRYPGRLPEAIKANVFRNESSYFFRYWHYFTEIMYRISIFLILERFEDIPVGRSLGMTIGVNSQETNRIYMGTKCFMGGILPFLDTLPTHLEYGNFLRAKRFSARCYFTGRINYFTRLLSLGNWEKSGSLSGQL